MSFLNKIKATVLVAQKVTVQSLYEHKKEQAEMEGFLNSFDNKVKQQFIAKSESYWTNQFKSDLGEDFIDELVEEQEPQPKNQPKKVKLSSSGSAQLSEEQRSFVDAISELVNKLNK